MKKLCSYTILQAPHTHELGQLVERFFDNVKHINEMKEKEGDTSRYVLELVGGAFYAKELFSQAVAKYEISEEQK